MDLDRQTYEHRNDPKRVTIFLLNYGTLKRIIKNPYRLVLHGVTASYESIKNKQHLTPHLHYNLSLPICAYPSRIKSSCASIYTRKQSVVRARRKCLRALPCALNGPSVLKWADPRYLIHEKHVCYT